MIAQIDDMKLAGKTVIVQSNLDVPLHDDGSVADDTRLRASLDTIKELLALECRVILVGHLGRPKGRDESLSLRQIIPRLSELLGIEVSFIEDIDSSLVERVPSPGVGVLENIRMWPGEQEGSAEFAQRLASLAEVYVNDDYIDSHRSSAVNTQLPRFLPSCMGRTLFREWDFVRKATDNPRRPLTVILGGAKKDKLEVVEHVLASADQILLGGGLANTFLAARGIDMKQSLVDEKNLDFARELLERSFGRIHLPVDCVAARSVDESDEHTTCFFSDLPDEYMALDIGPSTIRKYSRILRDSRTVIWGGPIGVFENPLFAHGTHAIARIIAETNAYSLVAGGDSAAAFHSLGLADDVSHISIGGGATLHLIAGDELPAIAALRSSSQ